MARGYTYIVSIYKLNWFILTLWLKGSSHSYFSLYNVSSWSQMLAVHLQYGGGISSLMLILDRPDLNTAVKRYSNSWQDEAMLIMFTGKIIANRSRLWARQFILDFLHCLSQMKAIYQDYFSYLMDEKVMATKMAREFWNELDDMLPLGASLQQDVPNWPWATKVVVCLVNHRPPTIPNVTTLLK